MNTLSTIIPANEARANFYQILDEVNDQLRQFTITLRGRQKAVIMSAEEYEGWLETFDIMSNPKLVTSIKKGVKELKAGKGIPASKANKMIGW
ncbi:MAG: type II toxin-antitoxin system Phd/YefM family antitoxin [Patescibacteria group bacterium]